MDFGTLLYAAHKNEKTANKDTKCYKTKFEPPKKEIKSRSSLSANIQKYLQKRDEDEKKKVEDEKRKKDDLIALRSQDRKAFKRVQTMLKRTKSANKSVIEDAVDNVNTAVTLGGPQQCDEDDYGYVSQEATAYYAKLMDKYSNMPPEEPKFPQAKKPVVKDLNAAKDRVRAALQKEEEEELMPHKRKRKSKADKLGEDHGSDNDERQEKYRDPSPEQESKPKKVKKMAPPPLDFSSLLKLAEQKQFEPVKIEKKVSEEEDGRPMTKKQRMEFERERERKERQMERRMEEERSKKSGQRQPDSVNRIPKISENGERKEKLNGFGRIPKKSSAPSSDTTTKNRSLHEETKRRNSVDSDNSSKSNNPNQRDRSSIKPGGDRPNDQKSERASYKNHHVSEKNHHQSNHSSSSDRKIESSQSNYDRKPSQASIAVNKIKSRMHNVSDQEQSEASDVENERSSSSGQDRQYKTDKYSSKQSSSQDSLKRSRDKYSGSERNRSPSPDNSKYKPKYSISQSDSGTEDETKYKPRSINSSTIKKQKIKSLFEGSDDDGCNKKTTNHDSYKPESKKPKPSFDLERQRKPFEDSKFKIPKQSLKSDNDRVKKVENPEKHKNSEKIKTASSITKQGSVKDKDKSKTNDLRSDSQYPKSSSDKNRSVPERPKEKLLPSKEIVKKESSMECSKKPNHPNAEEALKKDASVWSKPCNLPAKHPSGLSESQIQRLREMNKKPTAARPGELNKQSPRDVRSSDGRPPPRPGGSIQGKPSLMKAAAAAAAARSASQKPPSNSCNKEKDSPSKLEKGSSSRSHEKQPTSKNSLPPSRPKESNNKDSRPRQLPPKDLKPKQFPPSDMRPKQFPPSDLKPRQFPPSDLKPRQFPPSDLRPRQFPPKDVRPRQFPPPDVRKKPNPRRIIEDDSEEYDSEMDDFIDDGSDCDQQRISEEIQSIFGYDKNRYIMDDDEDDECMESNFGQIDREELRSLKIGAAEDLKELLKEIKRKKKRK